MTSRRPASPGPAEYDVDAIDALGKGTTSGRPRSATTRIGTARRFRPASSLSPGPAYNPEITPVRGRAPAYSFGTDPRDPPGSRPRSAGAVAAAGGAGGAGLGLPSRPQSPGPAEYDVTINGLGHATTSTHARSPIAKFPLADRFASARPSSPAPGAYGTPPVLRFPSPPRPVMGSAPRSASVKLLSPAPGTYDVMAAVKSVRPRSAQTRFGTSHLFSAAQLKAALALPGPDAYDACAPSLALKSKAPTTVFGSSARSVVPKPAAPGPVYSVDGSFAAVLHRPGTTKIGTAPRFASATAMASKCGPSPADYGRPVRPLPSSPQWTMRPR